MFLADKETGQAKIAQSKQEARKNVKTAGLSDDSIKLIPELKSISEKKAVKFCHQLILL